ncbi:MAG TPA: hypothetical protein VJX23_03045 [Candidatus Binataceae bacterium]|nr:hypothetical protein [Candidatus Binataceae bacterium]
MSTPYYSPAWTKQQAEAQHAMAKLLPAMHSDPRPAQFWDFWNLVLDFTNGLFALGSLSGTEFESLARSGTAFSYSPINYEEMFKI